MQVGDVKQKCVEMVPLRDGGGPAYLFCIPGAGGEVAIFKEMTHCMGVNESVYAMDMRRFFDVDRKFTVEELADLCLSVIEDAGVDGPYHFCGYSFGAIVAYEVANRLRRNGESVGVVAMIDTGNPAFGNRLSSAEATQRQKAYLSNRVSKYLRFLAEGNMGMFAGSVLALLASRAGVRSRRVIRAAFFAFNRPMPVIFRNNDRALMEAWSAYKPPCSDLSLLLYYGDYRQAEHGGDHTLGWNACTSGLVDVEIASQGHVDLMKRPHVGKFAVRLIGILEAN
jgi:thioesterase domain-containing protein